MPEMPGELMVRLQGPNTVRHDVDPYDVSSVNRTRHDVDPYDD